MGKHTTQELQEVAYTLSKTANYAVKGVEFLADLLGKAKNTSFSNTVDTLAAKGKNWFNNQSGATPGKADELFNMFSNFAKGTEKQVKDMGKSYFTGIKSGLRAESNKAGKDTVTAGVEMLKNKWNAGKKSLNEISSFNPEVSQAGSGMGRFLGGSRTKAMEAAAGGKQMTGKALQDYNDEMNKVIGSRVGAGAAGVVGLNMLSNR